MPEHFWPSSTGWLLMSTSFVVALASIFLVRRVLRPTALARATSAEFLLTFCEGERDRLQAIAKGVAASGSAFFIALVTALLKGDIGRHVASLYLICCTLGILGGLLLAAQLSRASALFMASMAPQEAKEAKEAKERW